MHLVRGRGGLGMEGVYVGGVGRGRGRGTCC